MLWFCNDNYDLINCEALFNIYLYTINIIATKILQSSTIELISHKLTISKYRLHKLQSPNVVEFCSFYKSEIIEQCLYLIS